VRYDGTWVAGQRQGFGIVSRPDGSGYQGDWLNGKRHGQGRETSSDNSFHDGGWESNQPFGPGIRRSPSGIRISGVWNDDHVSTGLLGLPTGHEYAGPLFKNNNAEVSPLLRAWVTELAKHGDPYAQLFLGTIFSDFKKPSQDVEQSRLWYGKAASAGVAEAQYRLALTHSNDNVARSIELLVQAAQQDHAAANGLLGDYYLAGDRVPRNLQTAIRYQERAIAAGSIQARNKLAWILATTTASEFRDGKRAVALIRPLALLYGNWEYLDTLAAAFAESKNFDQAIFIQERALEEATRGDAVEAAIVVEMRQRLQAFQQRLPIRE
jgi:TPR repeat protein